MTDYYYMFYRRFFFSFKLQFSLIGKIYAYIMMQTGAYDLANTNTLTHTPLQTLHMQLKAQGGRPYQTYQVNH